MKIRFIELLLSSIVLLGTGSSHAWIEQPGAFFEIKASSVRYAEQAGLSLEDAAARIREQTGGRILSAKIKTRDGGMYYRIKVLMPGGVVRSFTVNPQEGGRR